MEVKASVLINYVFGGAFFVICDVLLNAPRVSISERKDNTVLVIILFTFAISMVMRFADWERKNIKHKKEMEILNEQLRQEKKRGVVLDRLEKLMIDDGEIDGVEVEKVVEDVKNENSDMKWGLSWLNLQVKAIRLYLLTLPEGWVQRLIIGSVVLGLVMLALGVRNCQDVRLERKQEKRAVVVVKEKVLKTDSLRGSLKIISDEKNKNIGAVDVLSDDSLRKALEKQFGGR